MEDLSLHLLDIAENSIRAKAKNIKIKIEENRKKDLLYSIEALRFRIIAVSGGCQNGQWRF